MPHPGVDLSKLKPKKSDDYPKGYKNTVQKFIKDEEFERI